VQIKAARSGAATNAFQEDADRVVIFHVQLPRAGTQDAVTGQRAAAQ
jgi:hypothetical protein